MAGDANHTIFVGVDEVARVIDHTLLKPEASCEQIRALCEEAAQFHFVSACVNPCWTALASGILRGTDVKVCAVAGFPLGATYTEVKAFEARDAIQHGAREIDMVMHVGALKSGDDRGVEVDIRAIVELCHASGAICKVILETAVLTDEEKRRASIIAKNAGADFVKTSTGFGPGGATAEDVAIMRAAIGPKMGVKASGGIRTFGDLKEMIAAGATRIGTSSGVKILEEARRLLAR